MQFKSHQYWVLTSACLFILTLADAASVSHQQILRTPQSDAFSQSFWSSPDARANQHGDHQSNYASASESRDNLLSTPREAAPQVESFNAYITKLDRTMKNIRIKERESGKNLKVQAKDSAKLAIALTGKEPFTPGNIQSLEAYLRSQRTPPKGWTAGDGAWRMARWELLQTVRKHSPFWKDLMLPFVTGAEPKLLDSYFSQPVPKVDAPKSLSSLDLGKIDAEGFAYYSVFRNQDLSPVKQKQLAQYLKEQKALPEIFPNTAANRNFWNKFRGVMVKNNQHLIAGLQNSIDRKQGRPVAEMPRKKPSQSLALNPSRVKQLPLLKKKSVDTANPDVKAKEVVSTIPAKGKKEVLEADSANQSSIRR